MFLALVLPVSMGQGSNSSKCQGLFQTNQGDKLILGTTYIHRWLLLHLRKHRRWLHSLLLGEVHILTSSTSTHLWEAVHHGGAGSVGHRIIGSRRDLLLPLVTYTSQLLVDGMLVCFLGGALHELLPLESQGNIEGSLGLDARAQHTEGVEQDLDLTCPLLNGDSGSPAGEGAIILLGL